jgi:formylglycine-generating enzyme required for sulfatase activity
MYKLFIILFAALTACSLDSSPSTGWDYNSPRNGGFQKVPYFEQETGPGLELIEGGLLEVPFFDSVKQVIVPSFYLDRTEITNRDWCEYMYWTERTFGTDYPEIVINALPDTNVWREVVGFSESMELSYLRHPSFANYPVVGISWMQANNYCAWRTDRVNEYILIREGILIHNPNQQNEPFTTNAYLSGQYEVGINYKKQLPDLNPSHAGGSGRDLGSRIVRLEDGILLPRYRLPTEAEWEYAYITSSANTTISTKEIIKYKQSAQDVMGNFIKSNDFNRFNGFLVAPVDAYLPNDNGIYNLAGNVQEWVLDSYYNEERLYQNEVLPFNGDEMEVPVRNSQLQIEEKLSFPIYDLKRVQRFITEFEELRLKKKNVDSVEYELFNKMNEYLSIAIKEESEGKIESANRLINTIYHEVLEDFNTMYRNASFGESELEIISCLKQEMPKYIIDLPGNIRLRGITPWQRINARNGNLDARQMLDSNYINNDLKIVKGASWVDENELMNPFQRRTMTQYEYSATIGFRCAMDRLGSPTGLGKKNKKQKNNSKTNN